MSLTSFRRFMFMACLLTAAVGCAYAADPITAQDVIDRIKKNVNTPWQEKTVDTIKAGNPGTRVTGVAVTFMPTLDVLQRAAASGKNLIITHEPTFYNGQDETANLESDAVVAAKRAFIEKSPLVIFRFHDHMHARQPDGITEGMVEAFGWAQYRQPGRSPVFVLPETTLGKLAAYLRDQFHAKSIRVIGDPAMKVTRVGFSAGAPASLSQIRMLQQDSVQVLIGGESREWETVEYARDAAAAGKGKALILLGHAISEEAGMIWCTRWLKGLIAEVPVEFIPAGEPFWSP
jgi:putative NIF3 family GTP cyclohydrolase 1 type 2